MIIKYTAVTLCLLLTPAIAGELIFADGFEEQTMLCTPVERHATYTEYRDLRRWVKHMQQDVDALKKIHEEEAN